MPQELISPEQFLERLTTAFADPSSSGSIWLSHKRYTYEDGDVAMDEQTDGEGGKEHDVLIRCTKGDTKFSSRIPSSRLVEFHSKYGSLLKASLAPHMRKRDKKKEKARAEAAANKKREAYLDVEITGKKRGAGHRQRQRKVQAQKKKEAERERIEAREAKAKEGTVSR
ncbi:signal recognition particle, SRP9/SRP14 subunit [Papiliotrema laurentii]|uniref:Signal recognition particle subunit SRP14 n=1 Tax=Papiliotrema laurentii TaxID=5418 RepID=A0AAD9FPY4_PAPLA|nr:signal recognition particle, SRP9/SRP14 subunit [Papiliotrema laurentii]